MKLTEAYTVFNNNLHSMDSQLAEAIDRILDDKNNKLEKSSTKNGYLNVFLQQRVVNGWGNHVVDVAMQHIEKQEKEIERLREALEEYATNENYERVANEPDICEAGYSHPTWEPSWIELDNGETARKALAGESNV